MASRHWSFRIQFFKILFLVGSSTFVLSSPAFCDRQTLRATSTASRDVKQIVSLTNSLMVAARDPLSQFHRSFAEMKASMAGLGTLKSKLQAKKGETEKAHKTFDAELKKASFELYGLETARQIIPQLVSYHALQVDFVHNYESQAVFKESPQFIEGDVYDGRRPAMRRIVTSQEKGLQNIRTIVRKTTDTLTAIQNELVQLSNGTQPSLVEFGADHYVHVTLQRLDAQRAIMERTQPLYTGKNLAGDALLPSYPCGHSESGFGPFSPLSQDAYAMANVAPKFPLEKDWKKSVDEAVIRGIYNGDPATSYPGWISSWTGCVNNNKNIVQALRNDIARERLRGNLDLAAKLDLQRSDVQYDATVYESERDTVVNRRDLVVDIVASADIQAAGKLETENPGAWRKTAFAHALDIAEAGEIYSPILSATAILIDKTKAEIAGLSQITDSEARKAAYGVVAAKIGSIVDKGAKRIIEQLDSGIDNIRVMATGIGGGEVFLEDAIFNYEKATRLKFEDMTAERDVDLPQQISNASSKLVNAQANFDNSFALYQQVLSNIAAFDGVKLEFETQMGDFEKKVELNQYKSIYSEVISRFFMPYRSKKEYKSLSSKLTPKINALLSSFAGVEAAKLSSATSRARKAKQSKFVKTLAKRMSAMQKVIMAEIDEASTMVFSGDTLSSRMHKLHELHSMMAGME